MKRDECPVCYKKDLDLFEFGCGAPLEAAHIMCSTCTEMWAARGRKYPFCRGEKAPPHTENRPVRSCGLHTDCRRNMNLPWYCHMQAIRQQPFLGQPACLLCDSVTL